MDKVSWFARLKKKAELAATTDTPACTHRWQSGEVRPPWIEHPGVPPWDFFWREAGEPWRTQVWEPYYSGLSEPAKAEYLQRWNVPEEWCKSYFDADRREFWDHVDDPENE